MSSFVDLLRHNLVSCHFNFLSLPLIFPAIIIWNSNLTIRHIRVYYDMKAVFGFARGPLLSTCVFSVLAFGDVPIFLLLPGAAAEEDFKAWRQKLG
ncbi:hypothetical protein F5B18DRAFT_433088 [Nemania serpens]|nr:hypothetical protein F5B18DRAFT_433088 [Nemania serpens]